MKADVSVGKLVATFGLKGELVLLHALGGKADLKDVKVLFVEQQRGSTIPYFLESAKAKSAEETWVKLEGINTKEAAAMLLQKNAWLTEADFNRHVKPNATIALLGYTVVENGKEIGIISEIIEQPHQVLCAVMVQEKEALIPLNESTLKGIDRKKKTVNVTLPDGLLEIYL
jgi:16S rRNA processing protein RimM